MPIQKVPARAIESSASSANLNIDAGTLYLDAANNRVGVGNTSPTAKLDVVAPVGLYSLGTFRTGDTTSANNAGGGFYGISSATAGSRYASMWLDADNADFANADYFWIQKFGGSGVVNLIQASNDAMTFQTNSIERMRITAGGLVGINTTTIGSRLTLDVKIGSYSDGIDLVNSTDWGYGTSINFRVPPTSAGAVATVAQIQQNYVAANQFDLRFFTYNSGLVERMRLNSTGALVLNGGTVSADGVGITFPATQSPSSNANTLDDYEEGTFTPTFASSGGSITAYNSNGFYIKIGRMVFVQLFCNVTNVGSASGTLNFAGLPFGVNGAFGANQGQVAAVIRESNMTGTNYYAYMPGGNSSSGYITSASSGGITWSSNGIWPLTFTYYTSS